MCGNMPAWSRAEAANWRTASNVRFISRYGPGYQRQPRGAPGNGADRGAGDREMNFALRPPGYRVNLQRTGFMPYNGINCQVLGRAR